MFDSLSLSLFQYFCENFKFLSSKENSFLVLYFCRQRKEIKFPRKTLVHTPIIKIVPLHWVLGKMWRNKTRDFSSSTLCKEIIRSSSSSSSSWTLYRLVFKASSYKSHDCFGLSIAGLFGRLFLVVNPLRHGITIRKVASFLSFLMTFPIVFVVSSSVYNVLSCFLVRISFFWSELAMCSVRSTFAYFPISRFP